MRERLFDPRCFEQFCRSFTEEMTRLRREHLVGQAGQRRELAAVERRQREITDAIAQLRSSSAVIANARTLTVLRLPALGRSRL